MTDREKLIELLENDDCPLLYVLGENMGALADYLIANGVTVQDVPDANVGKWIPVTKETPTESDGTVWICLADKFPYNEKEPYAGAKHDSRVTEAVYGEYSKRWYRDGAIFPDGAVTHWMKKAKPPKEGE